MIMVAAFGLASVNTNATAASPETTVSPGAFANALRDGDVSTLSSIFAPNAVFYTPVLSQPVVGRAHVVKLVTVLFNTFQDRHITAEFKSPGHFALAFNAAIGTQPISIFDLITFDRRGRIVKFVSHGRPLAGIQALATAVRPHIADILG